MNKRGSEMVEAAFVLPLLLLAVVSIIYYGVFCHDAFKKQIEVQEILLTDAEGDGSVFSILREDDDYTFNSKGLFKGAFRRAYSQRVYVINEELIVRGKVFFGSVVDE